MCFTWLHSFFVEISSWTDSDSGPRSAPHTHKHSQLLTSFTLPILGVWLLRGWLGTFHFENPLDNQKIDGELKRSSSVWSWWRSSITQNTDHFCKARTSLKLSGKSWCCVYCADKVATGTLSQLTMDNGNEEPRTQATTTLRQNTLGLPCRPYI